MRKILSFTLMLAIVFTICACATSEESIIGSWKNQKTVLGVVTETVYTFNEDGTGTKTNVLSVDFTYAFSENTLIITTSTLGFENTEEYGFEFKGNTLILTGGEETLKLEKVK